MDGGGGESQGGWRRRALTVLTGAKRPSCTGRGLVLTRLAACVASSSHYASGLFACDVIVSPWLRIIAETAAADDDNDVSKCASA